MPPLNEATVAGISDLQELVYIDRTGSSIFFIQCDNEQRIETLFTA
jgi:hypothetical protein